MEKKYFLLLILALSMLAFAYTVSAVTIGQTIASDANTETSGIIIESQDYIDKYFTWNFTQVGDAQYTANFQILNASFLNAVRNCAARACSNTCWTQIKNTYLPEYNSSKICADIKNITNYPRQSLSGNVSFSAFSYNAAAMTGSFNMTFGNTGPARAKFGFGSTTIDQAVGTPWLGSGRQVCWTTDGTVHAVWRYNDTKIAYARGTSNGASWTSTYVDFALTSNMQPGISCSGQNVAWGQINISNGDLFWRGSTDGGASFTSYNWASACSADYTAIEVRGNRMYAACKNNNADQGVNAFVGFINGTFTGVAQRVNITGKDFNRPTLGVYGIGDDNDHIWVGGTETTTTNDFYYSYSADSGATWSAPKAVSTTNTYMGRLSADATRVWYTQYPGTAGDYVYVFNSTHGGATWTAGTAYSATAAASITEPSMGFKHDGTPCIFFNAQNETGADERTSKYVCLNSTGGWGSATTITTVGTPRNIVVSSQYYGDYKIHYVYRDSDPATDEIIYDFLLTDTTAPATPTGLSITDQTTTTLTAAWTNPADADFNHTEVWRDTTFAANISTPTATYQLTGLTTSTTYNITLVPVDHAGNRGTNASILGATMANLALAILNISADNALNDTSANWTTNYQANGSIGNTSFYDTTNKKVVFEVNFDANTNPIRDLSSYASNATNDVLHDNWAKAGRTGSGAINTSDVTGVEYAEFGNGSQFNLASSWSAEFVFKKTTDADYGYIFAKKNTTLDSMNAYIGSSETVSMITTAGTVDFTAASAFTLNVWHHTIVQVNSSGTGARAILDGVAGSWAAIPQQVQNPYNLRIGSREGITYDIIPRGILDELRIYNYILSDTQIAENYAAWLGNRSAKLMATETTAGETWTSYVWIANATTYIGATSSFTITGAVATAPTYVLEPYIMIVNSTAEILRLKASEAVNLSISYKTTVGGSWTTVTNSTSSAIHEYVITGLTTGTSYDYNVTITSASGGINNSYVSKFVTESDSTTNFRFAVVSDSQGATTCGAVAAVGQAMYDEIATSRSVDFMIVTGDALEMAGCSDLAANYASGYTGIHNATDQFRTSTKSIPIMYLIGNHEMNSTGTYSAVSQDAFQDYVIQPTNGNGTTNYEETIYSLRYGNSLFVMLNTEEDGLMPNITGNQFSWFNSTLQTAGLSHKFVFAHKALAGSYRNDTWYTIAGRNPAWSAVLDSTMFTNGVTAAFYGHEHNYNQITTQGGDMIHVINGGAGDGLANCDWNVTYPTNGVFKSVCTKRYGYLIVQVNGTHMTTYAYNNNSALVETFERDMDTTVPSSAYQPPTPANGSTSAVNSVYTNVSGSDTTNRFGSFTVKNGELAAWWKLDNNMVDSAGTFANGTLNNGSWYNQFDYGAVRNGMKFDRSLAQFITIPNSGGTLSLDDFTASSWVKIPAVTVPDDYYIVVQGDKCAGTNQSWRLNVADDAGHLNEARFAIESPAVTIVNIYSNGKNITDNQWHQIVGRRIGTNMSIFVDGIYYSSSTVTTTPIVATENITIGGEPCAGTENMNGTIDDVKIINRALSDAEILANYNMSANYQNNFTSLESGTWYNFTTYAIDAAGNSNTTILSIKASTCLCPTDSTWGVDMSENCVINTACSLGASGALTFANTGNFYVNATITTDAMGDPGNGATVWMRSVGIISIT